MLPEKMPRVEAPRRASKRCNRGSRRCRVFDKFSRFFLTARPRADYKHDTSRHICDQVEHQETAPPSPPHTPPQLLQSLASVKVFVLLPPRSHVTRLTMPRSMPALPSSFLPLHTPAAAPLSPPPFPPKLPHLQANRQCRTTACRRRLQCRRSSVLQKSVRVFRRRICVARLQSARAACDCTTCTGCTATPGCELSCAAGAGGAAAAWGCGTGLCCCIPFSDCVGCESRLGGLCCGGRGCTCSRVVSCCCCCCCCC